MKRLIIILTAAALLTAASILCYNLFIKKSKSVGEYIASVNSFIFSGDYGGAVAECADGIRHYPESADLYILKARAYILSGDTAKALGTLDRGYKQTQSEDILEHREQIAEVFIDSIEFLPLTEFSSSPENPDGSFAVSGESGIGDAAVREPYRPDSPIKVTIPSVSPPPPPKENIETTFPETSTDSGENKTESE